MSSFDIFVDSGANIPQNLYKERNIHVISFTMTVNGEERLCLEEGVSFTETAKKFYADMRTGAEVRTSLVNAERFAEVIIPALEAGRDAVVITIAKGISGTYKQALEAKERLEAQFPERRVFVLDSANASMGTGLLALKAAELRDLGESAETTAKWIEDNAYFLNSYLTVGDLKYLRRSGRVSMTLAIAGTILNIKPLLRADGGEVAQIVFYGKTHGRKKALAALAETYKERAISPETQTVAICHCDCEEDALSLAEAIKQIGAKEVIIEYYDLCTGSHVGPGTVALFFYGKDRRETLAEKKKPADKTVPVNA